MTDYEYPDYCKLDKPLIFDSHAHLDDEKFEPFRDELLTKLPRCGVDKVITCGCDITSSKMALNLANQYDYIYAAVGIHPQNINTEASISSIKALAIEKKCVAIGEIGLDYYWERDNKSQQIQFFEKQILLAKELDMPIIVHDREAHEDTLKLLLKHKPKGVLHCFSGSKETAKEIIKIGMYIGVGGVVTFKNAKNLPEVIQVIPDNKLLLETDCPYLAPEPLRGKLCHSGLITLTAQKIAQLKNVELERLLLLTNNNAHNLFEL